MSVTVIEHPLAQDLLTKLRNKNTSHSEYKALSTPLAMMIALEATKHIEYNKISIDTPIFNNATGIKIKNSIILVPVLRAGLSMLSSINLLFPDSHTGFIGLQRSEQEIEPHQYYLNIPPVSIHKDATVLILDPMIATGGSACAAIKHIKELGYNNIKLISFLAAPEGISLLEQKYPEVEVYTASIDQKLDENKYIIPGLGDFGDRLFGTPHQSGC